VEEKPPVTYRWRRRDVPRIRITWVGQVAMFLLLLHQFILRTHPMGMVGRAGLFILVVLIPVVLVSLWRAGLLPPERVPVDQDPQP
jgi:fucose 4-O-acetylase-like acetyltransferase